MFKTWYSNFYNQLTKVNNNNNNNTSNNSTNNTSNESSFSELDQNSIIGTSCKSDDKSNDLHLINKSVKNNTISNKPSIPSTTSTNNNKIKVQKTIKSNMKKSPSLRLNNTATSTVLTKTASSSKIPTSNSFSGTLNSKTKTAIINNVIKNSKNTVLNTSNNNNNNNTTNSNNTNNNNNNNSSNFKSYFKIHKSNPELFNLFNSQFQSLVHYGDNIGARVVKCLINENLYESQSLINQDYDIYQV
jgi:hypothetical protein